MWLRLSWVELRDLGYSQWGLGWLCGSNSEAGALWRQSSDHGAAPAPELGLPKDNGALQLNTHTLE